MSTALVRNPGDGQDFRYCDNVIEQVATNAEHVDLAALYGIVNHDGPPPA